MSELKPGTIVSYVAWPKHIAMIIAPLKGGSYPAIALVNQGSWYPGMGITMRDGAGLVIHYVRS